PLCPERQAGAGLNLKANERSFGHFRANLKRSELGPGDADCPNVYVWRTSRKHAPTGGRAGPARLASAPGLAKCPVASFPRLFTGRLLPRSCFLFWLPG